MAYVEGQLQTLPAPRHLCFGDLFVDPLSGAPHRHDRIIGVDVQLGFAAIHGALRESSDQGNKTTTRLRPVGRPLGHTLSTRKATTMLKHVILSPLG